MQKQLDEYSSDLMSKYHQFGTQNCLLAMIEKLKKNRDKKGIFAAVQTDFSKAFDCIPHDLLIAKLSAYGFNRKSLIFISADLESRKQKTRIELAFSDYLNILLGVPKGPFQVQVYLSFSCLIYFLFLTIWTTRAMLMIPLLTFPDRIILKLLNFQNRPLTVFLLGSKIMDWKQIPGKVIF